ncbi:MAG: succinylglutamate desuccinylase/aspartoacylase family protein [Deferribacteres bacterium]|nr:succinylglutamate desuccinylase/aspartoacylase family protein [candidate division KSB1 bacterium]MCB9504277.1 succinylglutamate desuccinylase/aspartoacylase family protein [Deferribacteres bacterium]
MKKVFFIFLLFSSCAGYRLTQEAQIILADFDSVKNAEKIELIAGTPYETSGFLFDSGKPGEAILILGGTHGNEPAGYEAALRLLQILQTSPPQKGKVILIPLANRMSIDNYKRRVPVPKGIDKEKGNLNRCYPGEEMGLPMQQMAWQIQELAREHHVTIFIDMHEARYLHLDTPKGSYRDQGLGQTLIYYPNEPSSWLTLNMLDQINETIDNPKYHFSAIEEPILHSAAWWAGKELGIAAFTFETARILELQQRINWHLKLAEIVFKESGIW